MYPMWRNTSNVNSSQFHDWNELILTSCKHDILKLCWGSSIINNPNLNTLEFCLGLQESIAWVQTPFTRGKRDLFFKTGPGSAVHRLGPTGHGFFLKLGNSMKSRPLDIFKTVQNYYEKFYIRLCWWNLPIYSLVNWPHLFHLVQYSANVGNFFWRWILIKHCIVSKFRKKKESHFLVFTSSKKGEISNFHVVVVQRRQRNMYKKTWWTCKVVVLLNILNILTSYLFLCYLFIRKAIYTSSH